MRQLRQFCQSGSVFWIICREATPAFMQKDYSTGLELVTLRTAARFAKEFNFNLDAPPLH